MIDDFGTPPTPVETTARPAPIASSKTSGNPSRCELSTKTSMSRNSAGTSARAPSSRTKSSMPKFGRASRKQVAHVALSDDQEKRIRMAAFHRANASSSRPCPFSGLRRPTVPTTRAPAGMPSEEARRSRFVSSVTRRSRRCRCEWSSTWRRGLHIAGPVSREASCDTPTTACARAKRCGYASPLQNVVLAVGVNRHHGGEPGHRRGGQRSMERRAEEVHVQHVDPIGDQLMTQSVKEPTDRVSESGGAGCAPARRLSRSSTRADRFGRRTRRTRTRRRSRAPTSRRTTC